MPEYPDNRAAVSAVTRELLRTFGKLEPKLEHLSPTPLPDKALIIQLLDDFLEVIYPGYFGRKFIEMSHIEIHLSDLMISIYERLTVEIYRSVRPECSEPAVICAHCQGNAEQQSLKLMQKLPDLRARLSVDVQAAYDGDPAAKGFDEVIFAYPAIVAITIFRIAHELHAQGIPLLPRIMTEHAHSITGIDIHPGATIGKGFFIDHGTGVVIGETTIIGNHVKLYQGVTLGALSFAMDEAGRLIRGKKRHPTIEDNVVIYAGATILGGSTVIGKGSVIGGNVWLTHSIPPNTKFRNEA
ncbi:MAG TPA: serine O-acetyltransferase EpsC [Terriglobia bacterium]|nr:serine O-acetyltransferase EpsC [Terriglobia bacterium]